MDRNTVFGLLIIFGILIVYSMWMSPSQEELKRQQEIRDSLQRVEQQRQEQQEKQQEQQAETTEQDRQQQDALRQDEQAREEENLQNQLGSFASVAKGENKHYTIENEVMELKISSKGGRVSRVRLKNYQSYDSLPVILFTEENSKFGFTFFSDKRAIETNKLYFTPEWVDSRFDEMKEMTIQGNEELQFAMRLYPARTKDSEIIKDHYIEYLYTIKGDSYMMDFDVRFVGMEDYVSRTSSYIDLDWQTDLRRQDRELGRNIGTG